MGKPEIETVRLQFGCSGKTDFVSPMDTIFTETGQYPALSARTVRPVESVAR